MKAHGQCCRRHLSGWACRGFRAHVHTEWNRPLVAHPSACAICMERRCATVGDVRVGRRLERQQRQMDRRSQARVPLRKEGRRLFLDVLGRLCQELLARRCAQRCAVRCGSERRRPSSAKLWRRACRPCAQAFARWYSNSMFHGYAGVALRRHLHAAAAVVARGKRQGRVEGTVHGGWAQRVSGVQAQPAVPCVPEGQRGVDLGWHRAGGPTPAAVVCAKTGLRRCHICTGTCADLCRRTTGAPAHRSPQ